MSVAGPEEASIPPFPVRRWSVEEYELFARLGIFDEDDDLELLDGWIVAKMTKNPRHDGTVDELNRRLAAVLPSGWYVRCQNVLLTADSAPEPDIAVVRGVPRDYLSRHPSAADVALVIEVADSSLERDRLKTQIYGRAGVPAYWIVNLIENQVEVFAHPIGTGRKAAYSHEEIHKDATPIPISLRGDGIVNLLAKDCLP